MATIFCTKEWGEVRLEDRAGDGTQIVFEKAKEKRADGDDWRLLGLHLNDQGEPVASSFVGQVWLVPPNERPDQPEGVVLRVAPKSPEVSFLEMYCRCLSHPVVCRHLDKTFFFADDEPAIPTEASLADEMIPLIVVRYLQCLLALCRRHLRMASQPVEANLTGKVRGRPLVSQQVRVNLAHARSDRMVCRFQKVTLDTVPNRILRAALEQGVKYLSRLDLLHKALEPLVSFTRACLAEVSLRRISPLDFRGLHYRGMLAPYREPHRWARLLLNLLGYDPGEEPALKSNPTLPPFALDMNELFERYCETELRNMKGFRVWAAYQNDNLGKDFKVRPDFLVYTGESYRIYDAKYKPDWSWCNPRHRDDVYQVVTYACHEKVREKLDDLKSSKSAKVETDVVVLYPSMDAETNPARESSNSLDGEEHCGDLTVNLSKARIRLPLRNRGGVPARPDDR